MKMLTDKPQIFTFPAPATENSKNNKAQ